MSETLQNLLPTWNEIVLKFLKTIDRLRVQGSPCAAALL